MRPLLFAGLLILGACQSQQATTATYDAKLALLAADNVALAYLAQPPCAGPPAITCVDATMKARIKAASATATAARHAADAAIAAGKTPDNASLTAAVVAFAGVVAPFQSLVK